MDGQYRYTRDSFLQEIREKYPVYNEWDDEKLYNSVLEKYPVYRDQIEPESRTKRIAREFGFDKPTVTPEQQAMSLQAEHLNQRNTLIDQYPDKASDIIKLDKEQVPFNTIMKVISAGAFNPASFSTPHDKKEQDIQQVSTKSIQTPSQQEGLENYALTLQRRDRIGELAKGIDETEKFIESSQTAIEKNNEYVEELDKQADELSKYNSYFIDGKFYGTEDTKQEIAQRTQRYNDLLQEYQDFADQNSDILDEDTDDIIGKYQTDTEELNQLLTEDYEKSSQFKERELQVGEPSEDQLSPEQIGKAQAELLKKDIINEAKEQGIEPRDYYKQYLSDLGISQSVLPDWIQKGFDESVTGRAREIINGKKIFDITGYEPSQAEELASAVFSTLVADAPMFALGGGVGGFVSKTVAGTKAAGKLFTTAGKFTIKKLVEGGIEEGVAKYMVRQALQKTAQSIGTSAGALGTYSAASKLADERIQKESFKNVNYMDVFKEGAIGTGLGATLGIVGTSTGLLTKKAPKVLAKGAEFAGEVATFGTLSPVLRGEKIQLRDYVDAAMFLGALRVGRGIAKLPKKYKEHVYKTSTEKYKLTDQHVEFIKGVRGLSPDKQKEIYRKLGISQKDIDWARKQEPDEHYINDMLRKRGISKEEGRKIKAVWYAIKTAKQKEDKPQKPKKQEYEKLEKHEIKQPKETPKPAPKPAPKPKAESKLDSFLAQQREVFNRYEKSLKNQPKKFKETFGMQRKWLKEDPLKFLENLRKRYVSKELDTSEIDELITEQKKRQKRVKKGVESIKKKSGKEVSANLIGYQQRANGTFFPLFNLEGGDNSGSTVTTRTLKKQKIKIPPYVEYMGKRGDENIYKVIGGKQGGKLMSAQELQTAGFEHIPEETEPKEIGTLKRKGKEYKIIAHGNGKLELQRGNEILPYSRAEYQKHLKHKESTSKAKQKAEEYVTNIPKTALGGMPALSSIIGAGVSKKVGNRYEKHYDQIEGVTINGGKILNTKSERYNYDQIPIEKYRNLMGYSEDVEVSFDDILEEAKREIEDYSEGKIDKQGIRTGGIEVPERVKEEIAADVFDAHKTDMPYYDQILRNPEYAKDEKGIDVKIKWMSPQEYLDIVTREHGEDYKRFIDKGSQKSLQEAYNKGEKLYTLVLEYHNDKFNQEGRNRAYFAMQKGIEKIPVAIFRDITEPSNKVPTSEKSIIAGDLKVGDEFTIVENGKKDKVKVSKVEEGTGDVLLADGRTIKKDIFDKIKYVGKIEKGLSEPAKKPVTKRGVLELKSQKIKKEPGKPIQEELIKVKPKKAKRITPPEKTETENLPLWQSKEAEKTAEAQKAQTELGKLKTEDRPTELANKWIAEIDKIPAKNTKRRRIVEQFFRGKVNSLSPDEQSAAKIFIDRIDKGKQKTPSIAKAPTTKAVSDDALLAEAKKYKTAEEFFEKVIKPMDSYAPEYRNPIIENWRQTKMKPLADEAYKKGVYFSTNPIQLESSLDSRLEKKYSKEQLANMSVAQKSNEVLGEKWTKKYRQDILEGGSPYKLIEDFWKQAQEKPVPKPVSKPEKAEEYKRTEYDKPTEEQIKSLNKVIEESKSLPFKVSPSDVNAELTYRAHSGTSFEPEIKAAMYRRIYIKHMIDMYDSLKKYAKSEEQKEILTSEMERYRDNYLKKMNEYLSANSRVVSAMIVGPSNFPTTTMQKRNQTVDNRREEWLDITEKAEKSIKSKLRKQSVADQGGEIAVMEKKLAKAKKLHETMKKTNAIVRKKISDNERVKQIVGAGLLSETQARKILVPDYLNRIGFASYSLTNNLANIKRMEQRLIVMKRREARSGKNSIVKTDDYEIVNNHDEGRVQIVFNEKPDDKIRDYLKHHGFRWSPKNGVWQRQNTRNGLWAAENFDKQFGNVQEKPKAEYPTKVEKPPIVVSEPVREQREKRELTKIRGSIHALKKRLETKAPTKSEKREIEKQLANVFIDNDKRLELRQRLNFKELSDIERKSLEKSINLLEKQARRLAKYQSGVGEERKPISQEEALKIVKDFLPEFKAVGVEKIVTDKGLEALGRLLNGTIAISSNPKETTPYHEVTHGYFDLLKEAGDYDRIGKIFDQWRKDTDKPNMSDDDVEENISEEFYDYYSKNKKPRSFLKELFEKIKAIINRLRKRVDEVKRFGKPVPAIAITPEMKSSVLYEGQPKFQLYGFEEFSKPLKEGSEAEKTEQVKRRLRQRIHAIKAGKGISDAGYKRVLKKVTGHVTSKHKDITIKQLEKVAERLTTLRPKSVKNRKVITEKTEGNINTLKGNLIENGEMTESDFNVIMKNLRIKYPGYKDKKNFITESQGRELINKMLSQSMIIKDKTKTNESLSKFPTLRKEIGNIEKSLSIKRQGKAKVNSLLDMHHYTDSMEDQTGVPFGRIWDIFDARRLELNRIIDLKIDQIKKDGGKDFKKISRDSEAIQRIEDYIASHLPGYVEEKPTEPIDITKSEKAIAKSIMSVLKNFEPDVRYNRFYEWREKGVEIPNAPRKDLKEATLILETQGNDALREYLKDKDWGIIRSGYDIGEVVKPTIKSIKPSPRTSPKHLRSRETVQYQTYERNILTRFGSYVRQMTYRTELRPYVQTWTDLWEMNYDKFEHPPKVADLLERNLREMLGQRDRPTVLSRYVINVYSQAARVIFLDIRKGVRNLFQNIAFYTSPEDIFKIHKMSEKDLNYFKTHVSQFKGIKHDWLYQDYKVNVPGISRLNELADAINVMGVSDEINRIACFKMKLEAVRKALRAYPKYKEDSEQLNSLMKKAGFADLTRRERIHALKIWAADDEDTMARYVAKQVTKKVHFLYERAERSPAEQGAEFERVLSNLLTFRKGYLQRLILDAKKLSKSERSVGKKIGGTRRSIRSIIGAVVGATFVGMLYQLLTGDKRNPYRADKILSDISLGGLATGMQEDIGQFTRHLVEAAEGNKASLGFVINEITTTSDNFLPFYDEIIDAVEGISGYGNIDRAVLRQVRSALDNRYKAKKLGTYKRDRGVAGGIQHAVFGTEKTKKEASNTDSFRLKAVKGY